MSTYITINVHLHYNKGPFTYKMTIFKALINELTVDQTKLVKYNILYTRVFLFISIIFFGQLHGKVRSFVLLLKLLNRNIEKWG